MTAMSMTMVFAGRLTAEARNKGISLAEVGRQAWGPHGARKAQRLASGTTVATVDDVGDLAAVLGLEPWGLMRELDVGAAPMLDRLEVGYVISAKAEFLLHALDWETRCDFAGVFTSRLYRRSVALALEGDGLLQPILLRVCNGDGWGLEPERHRWGWSLTSAGREQAQRLADRRRDALHQAAR